MRDTLLYGRSTIFGAACWMFGLSFVLSLLLWWIPILGWLAPPVIGGFIGGRQAGSPGRAFRAAIVPCVLLFLCFLFAGGLYGVLGHTPAAGVIGVLAGSVAALVAFGHNIVLMIAALIGGASRQADGSPF